VHLLIISPTRASLTHIIYGGGAGPIYYYYYYSRCRLGTLDANANNLISLPPSLPSFHHRVNQTYFFPISGFASFKKRVVFDLIFRHKKSFVVAESDGIFESMSFVEMEFSK